MIVVATADFRIYHEVVTELRDRGAEFTTVEPGADLPDRARLVVTGPDDDPLADAGDDAADRVEVVVAERDAPREAVEEAFASLRGEDGRTVVGIDPGTRPGVAVLSGDVVVAAFQVPVEDAARVVERELDGAVDPVVRIGDGARLQGSRLLDDLSDVRVELVDETATTPSLGTGARGMGDVLAAVNIARREGRVVENRTITPTRGELQVIKDRSRQRSPENRAIDEALARRVAAGDLSIDEALEEHRNGG